MTTAMQMSPGRRCRACVALEIARNCSTDYIAAERGPLLYSLVVTAVFFLTLDTGADSFCP